MGLLAALASAAPAPGERAGGDDDCMWDWDCPDGGSPTDNCPAGETCSPDTPYGLYFGGPNLGDDIWGAVVPPSTTAVGGTQTITVFANAHADGFSLPFGAATSSTSLAVTEVVPPRVRVHAAATTSSTYLRILEPDTDLLYDRIALSARWLSSVRLLPGGISGVLDYHLAEETDVGLAVQAGTASELVVALLDSSGQRLVDEEMVIASSLAGVTRDSARWDVIHANPPAPSTGQLRVTVGDNDPVAVSLRAVDSVDEIRWVEGAWSDAPPSDPLAQDRSQSFCFRAMNQGDVVLGVAWEYWGNELLSVERFEDTPELENCVVVTGLATGDGVLGVIAGGKTVFFPIEIINSSARQAKPRRAVPTPDQSTLDAGERADLR